ncbi:MAG: cation-translocating P-type ATPase [Candidatus Symbiothrix sp.]|jgi:Cd2+/Zn2+-exporting ATPase|nr:cation-translocating P-type ATPase [Candidatus Symbiothrix sp.]
MKLSLTYVTGAIGLEILSILGIDLPMPYAPCIYAVLILLIGYEVLWEGLQALFKVQFDSINLLMLIAVCAAFYLGEYTEALVVIALYILGEKLEDRGLDKSKSALDGLVSKSPKKACVKDLGNEIPVEEVAVGTIIQVKPHDLIPLDGEVTSGETAVDESNITGEPVAKEKRTGDTVFAGTLNQGGFIEIKTTKAASDTTFAQIVELTYQAQQNRSESQRFIQKFASVYTPIIIVLAVLLFVIPVFLLGQDLNKWLEQAVSLLVIACPCALVISTPVAIYAALGNASEKGILIKGGKYLETFATVKAIALDKTRTITFGKPVVSDVVPLNGAGMNELLACSAGTELFSEHPMAQAIVDYSRKEGYEPHKAEKFESVAGKGAKAHCITCNYAPVLVGNLEMISEQLPVGANPCGRPIATETGVRTIIDTFANQGKTCVIVSCNHDVKGVIALMDEVKPDSALAIQELQKLGIEPVMLTGDSVQAANHIASQVGIQGVYGSLLPQDKSAIIKQLKDQYQAVAMVGDGVNDAPALAESTVGIAMGAAGSDTALEVANIALMNDQLASLPYLTRLSRKTIATIKWNTAGAIGIKLLCIGLAFCGWSNLVFAIVADVGVMLVVVLISLRLLKFT